MHALGDSGTTSLPLAIPAKELQRLVGDSEAFCSWDAANQGIDESTDHWPFLFSHPVVSAISKKPAA